ncbi:MAG: DUF6785 family protein [Planctomycetota bacterium]
MSSSDDLGAEPTTRRFVTPKSVVIGALMALLVGLHAPYWSVYLQSSRMYADYHTGGAAFWALVLLVVLNLGLGRLWKPLALRAEELMTVTAMTFISGSIASSGLLAHFVPMLSRVYYGANPGNRWHEVLWPELKEWMVPLDPNGGTLAIQRFWEGSGAAPIPWRVWAQPVLTWGVLLMALFACMTAVTALMRKQWVEYEHLSFPIAQVPGAICAAAEDPWGPASIFRHRVFWIGLAISFGASSIGGISNYLTGSGVYFRVSHKITGLGPSALAVNLQPVVVCLVFLIPNRIAFSVWTLTLAAWGAKSFLKAYALGMEGWMPFGSGPPEFQFISMGAVVAFVVGSLWLARGHLKRAARCALGLGDRAYDVDEPSSYRSIFLVMLVGALVVVAWYWKAGAHWWVGVLILLAFLAVGYGVARAIAQIGLPATAAPVLPNIFLGNLIGGGNLSGHDTALLGSQMWQGNVRNSPMAGAAHSMRLVERRRGGLLWALLLALALTYVSGFLCSIWLGYRHGALNMDQWFYRTSPSLPWYWATGIMEQNETFNWLGLTWTGIGGGIMLALLTAQRLFFWWPIHPVGFLIANSGMTTTWWFSVFAAWLVKVGVVRLGGQPAYRKGRRFCIGMVLGYFLAGGLWGILDTLTGVTGNQVFYL